MNLGLLSIAAVAYVIGSIPTAWIVRRIMAGTDIRTEGTGNVGARNLYDVSQSKAAGIGVMLADMAKGAIVVLLAQHFHGTYFAATAWAAVGVVLGHNYSIFLKFDGGRGLATATGCLTAMSPLPLVFWILGYLTGNYAIRKQVHIASMSGILATAILVWSIPNSALRPTMFVPCDDVTEFRLAVTGVSFVLFLRHIGAVREAIKLGLVDE
ncbi:MAG: glycerol-3-phosphate acyltransferase [Candidatus Kapabacteria bacterium]|nr:glycerol-3-phosphate acyltransferase [Candidatus Kapabacteria bacterium]